MNIRKNLNAVAFSIWLTLSSGILEDRNAYAQEVNQIITNNHFLTKNPIENIEINSNLWSNRLYVTKDWERVWEFRWNNEISAYELYNHRDWNRTLELEWWSQYTIGLLDRMNNLNFDFSFLDNWFSPEQIQNLMMSNYYNENIEEIIPEVKNHVLNMLYSSWIELNRSQYISFIEKSNQTMFILYYNKEDDSMDVLWYDLVSTWNSRRWRTYVETPSMIIDRSNFARWDWRAMWTDTQWYWEAWSEIRFLWRYYITKDWVASDRHLHNHREIHLAMHTTTPWWLTQLWRKLSEWCIRISRFMLSLYRHTWIADNINGQYIIIWDIVNDQEIYFSNREWFYTNRLIERSIFDLHNIENELQVAAYTNEEDKKEDE